MALHAAIDRQHLWRAIRDLLRHHVACTRVTLFLGHIGMGEARRVYTDPPLDQAEAWFEARGRANPFSPWIAAHVGARCYDFREVVGHAAAFRGTEFFRQFAQPEGWDKGFSVMFWDGDAMRAMFSLYRGEAQPYFTRNETREVLKLSRHIEIAIRRVEQVDRAESFRAALQDFARSLPAPLMLLDWHGRLEFANSAAYESAAAWNLGPECARALNPRDCFRMPGGVSAAVEHLRRAIVSAAPKSLARQMPGPVLVAHPADPTRRARVSPAVTGPASIAQPGFFVLFEEPLAITEPADPEVRRTRRSRALQALTPAERRVVALVCQGDRNADIARQLNKSVLTVKTQMNSILQKLGLQSRAQLIAHLK